MLHVYCVCIVCNVYLGGFPILQVFGILNIYIGSETQIVELRHMKSDFLQIQAFLWLVPNNEFGIEGFTPSIPWHPRVYICVSSQVKIRHRSCFVVLI